MDEVLFCFFVRNYFVHCICDFFGIVRIDKNRAAIRHFLDGRIVRRNYGRTYGLSFNDRDSKTFIESREDKSVGIFLSVPFFLLSETYPSSMISFLQFALAISFFIFFISISLGFPPNNNLCGILYCSFRISKAFTIPMTFFLSSNLPIKICTCHLER